MCLVDKLGLKKERWAVGGFKVIVALPLVQLAFVSEIINMEYLCNNTEKSSKKFHLLSLSL